MTVGRIPYDSVKIRRTTNATRKIHQAGQHSRKRKNQARKEDFCDYALIFNDDIGGGQECSRKIRPGHKGGKTEDGIGQARRREFGEFAKKDVGHNHGQQGLQDHPEHADRGLFVADFDVAPDEEIQQFAVVPQLFQAQVEPAARRLDANGIGSGGRFASELAAVALEVTEAMKRRSPSSRAKLLSKPWNSIQDTGRESTPGGKFHIIAKARVSHFCSTARHLSSRFGASCRCGAENRSAGLTSIARGTTWNWLYVASRNEIGPRAGIR